MIGMDKALIEPAQNDIDRDQRRDKEELVVIEAWKAAAEPWKRR